MGEINLLESFPYCERKVEKGWKTEENKKIAKRFDKEFFDGDRVNGYGGFYYDGRWRGVVKKLQELYDINSESAVLDIGCAKGFLLYDLQDMRPGIKVAGIDISDYALNNAMGGYGKYLENKNGVEQEKASLLEEKAKRKILPHMIKGSAERLPWPDNSFDVVLSINTTHNLPEDKIKQSIQEMNRVCRTPENMFIQVDGYKTPEEKQRMDNWVLTAETMKSVDGWLDLFNEVGYKGDYFWTTV